MALVHSYVRFSDPKQAHGTSLERQKDKAAEFCEKHKHTLSDLVFHDLGKSAYHERKQKALARFLVAIERGEVRSGEILLVEAVDRLSRKGIRATQDLCNKILDSGIDIAILSPIEKVYRANNDNDLGGAIELASFAYQASIYSDLLSERLKRRKVFERTRATENAHTPIGAPLPGWLERVDGKVEPIAEAVETLRFIFARTIDGLGATKLCGELNAHHKPLCKAKRTRPNWNPTWNKTYVRQLIRDRSVLGEYHPHVIENGKRVTIGSPITNYYPQIIDEQTWLAANAACTNRRTERGPTGKHINLFTGLLWHLIDDCAMHIYSYQKTFVDGHKLTYRRLKSYSKQINVVGASSATVDCGLFELAILTKLRELKPEDICGTSRPTIDLAAKREAIAKKDRQILRLTDLLATSDDNLAEISQTMSKLKDEIKGLKKELREQQPNLVPQTLAEVQCILDYAAEGSKRQELREAIKRLVKRIVVWPQKIGDLRHDRVDCLIQIEFHSGMTRTCRILEGKVSTTEITRSAAENVWKTAGRKQPAKGLEKGISDDMEYFDTGDGLGLRKRK